MPQDDHTTTPEKNPVIQFPVSLRDWFAGQALPALFEDHQKSVREGEFKCYPNWPEGIAQDSYRIADAMLAARQREEPQP